MLAFLDHRPVFKGHVLVLPRAHVVTLADLPAGRSARTFSRCSGWRWRSSRRWTPVAHSSPLNNKVSQSVAHLHTHVVPRTKGDGLRGFFWPRTKYASDDEAAAYAARISAALS